MKVFDKSKIEKEIVELPNGILTILLDAAVSSNINSIAIVGGVVRDITIKSKTQDSEIIFIDDIHSYEDANQSDLLLKMGLFELILHAAFLFILL